MREIIFLQVGHCGNKAGQKFWELVSREHCLDATGHYAGTCTIPRQRIDVYYDMGAKEVYSPRSIFVDLEPNTIKSLSKSPYGELFNPEYFIYGHNGAANNWAKGFYTEGPELLGKIMELARRQVETCDSFQGFQMVHSIGGGTGSGFGSLILRQLNQEYGKKIINTFSVVPSPKVSEVVVEPYSAVLSLAELISSSDISVCLDNEALHDIAERHTCAGCPRYEDLNHLIALAMSGITTSLRFPGQLNSSLKKLKVNMTPFEDLHFFFPAIAPIPPQGNNGKPKGATRPSTLTDITMQLFNPENHMVDCNSKAGTYLTCAAMFRGEISTQDIDESMLRLQENPNHKFSSWIPNNIKTAICNVPPAGLDMMATFLVNSTAITHMLARVHKQFNSMFEKKAYLHWYETEGMDLGEFDEARQKVQTLIDHYLEHEEGPEASTTLSSNVSVKSPKDSKNAMKKKPKK